LIDLPKNAVELAQHIVKNTLQHADLVMLADLQADRQIPLLHSLQGIAQFLDGTQKNTGDDNQ
jgi:hypothetical protein